MFTDDRYEPILDVQNMRWYVLDNKTGIQFNCNGKAHAIKKAADMNRADSPKNEESSWTHNIDCF